MNFKMKRCKKLFLSITLILICDNSYSQSTDIKIIGEMRNVMWKGQLAGNIYLDSISNKKHLYGFGPLENMVGEILIIDGRCYNATASNNKELKVEESYQLKAPFFGYTNIDQWQEVPLPDSIISLADLESFLNQQTQNFKRPFMFKLEGQVESAEIHVVNVLPGTIVKSPADVQKSHVEFSLNYEQVNIIGFFSTEHQAIFTHHDTYLHLHLINAEKSKMGHLDSVKLLPGKTKLFLPEAK